MKHSVNILNELQEISPSLAEADCSLPYSVPAGYFSGLADQILHRIRSGEELLPPVLRAAAGHSYTVPAGYFDGLADNLLQRVKAEAESLSAAAELSSLSPLLSSIGKQMPFEAPAGYFAGLEESVVTGTKAIDFVNEALENQPAVLAGLKDKQVYSLPDRYFEQLPAAILSKVQTTSQPARVVAFGARRVVRYVAAAVVAGLIAMGAWWLAMPTRTPDVAVANKVEKLSEDELQTYLETQSAPLPAPDLLAVNLRPDIEPADLSDLLGNVSDEEIQRYLDQNLLTQTATN